MKKIILFICLISLTLPVLADTIPSLNVPEQVNLNETITIFGTFSDTGGADANVLCAFYFLDGNMNLVERANDEYTDGTGRFSSNSIIITQPPFFWGQDYNAVIVCDTALASADFNVLNKRDIAFGFFTEYDWVLQQRNRDTFFIIGTLIILALIAAGIIWISLQVRKI